MQLWCAAASVFSVVATAAWVAQLAIGGLTAFAVASNVAFAADFVLIPLASRALLADSHPMVYGAALVGALAAGASFAHHLDRRLGDPAHTLDIAMGWVLYLHLALLAAHALVYSVVPWRRLLLLTSATEGAAIVALFSCYGAVYRRQRYVLVGCGAVAHACTFAHRLRRAVTRRAVSQVVLDGAALVLLQAVAAVAQGEVWVRAASPARYNVEHGYWHLLTALVFGVLSVQSAETLSDAAPEWTVADRACRAALVGFALFLATVVLTDTEAAPSPAVPVAQAALLGVSGWAVAAQARGAIDSI